APGPDTETVNWSPACSRPATCLASATRARLVLVIVQAPPEWVVVSTACTWRVAALVVNAGFPCVAEQLIDAAPCQCATCPEGCSRIVSVRLAATTDMNARTVCPCASWNVVEALLAVVT